MRIEFWPQQHANWIRDLKNNLMRRKKQEIKRLNPWPKEILIKYKSITNIFGVQFDWWSACEFAQKTYTAWNLNGWNAPSCVIHSNGVCHRCWHCYCCATKATEAISNAYGLITNCYVCTISTIRPIKSHSQAHSIRVRTRVILVFELLCENKRKKVIFFLKNSNNNFASNAIL